MTWFSSKITVTFIDDTNGSVIGRSKISPDDLPESFGIETSLQLAGDNWSVTSALPITKTEFSKTKKLAVRLRKIVMVNPNELSFSQLDITEHFDDNIRYGSDQWIKTTPLNATIGDPVSRGLPSLNATNDEVYIIASKMSILRESFPIKDDGVYCPICHIANTEIARLHTPCPKCGLILLKFGWT